MTGRCVGPPDVAAARLGPAQGELPRVMASLGMQGLGGKEDPLSHGAV